MTYTPENFMIWFEIPVADFEKSVAFYNEVFKTQLTVQDAGPNPIAMFPVQEGGRSGHLYPGKPAARGTGSTVHLACPDKLEDTMERLVNAGGEVVTDPIELPVGRFVYCLDPDGNSISLFT